MRKKILLTLAFSMNAISVFAQSQVSVYGRISSDMNWRSFSPSGSSQFKPSAGNIGGARIGFRGSEDLGAGLRLNFTIEGGFSPQNGSMKSLADRQSWVELSSASVGSLRMGKMYAFSDSVVARYAGPTINNYNLGASFISSNAKRAVFSSSNVDSQGRIQSLVGGNGHYENALSYVTPSLDGWILGLMTASSESNSIQGLQDRNTNPVQIKADYSDARKAYVITYSKNGGEGAKALWHLGGKYQFEKIAISAAYQYNGNTAKKHSATAGVEYRNEDYILRANYNWTQQPGITSENQLGATIAAQGVSSGSLRGVTLAAEKSMSKRTTLYMGVTQVQAQNIIFSNNSSRARQLIFGIDHWF